jgi:hypothetical protein
VNSDAMVIDNKLKLRKDIQTVPKIYKEAVLHFTARMWKK